MPDFPIVDTHVHLYDVQRLRYGWMNDAPQLNRTSLPADFDAARGPVRVERMVFVEVAVDAGLHLAEAEFVQELADRDPRIGGMVAHLPVERGEAIEPELIALERHKALRGIRRLIQDERDPSMCVEPGFIAGVRLLGRHGLSFDICIRHWQMVYAIELVRRCPEVQFVLDHIGKPDIRRGLREPWWSQMRALASLPNVACKISGVATEADHRNWTKDQLKPYVAHAIDCFGFDRAMFGSDWTVMELATRYPDWVALVDETIAGASAAEKRKLYRDNAIRIYRLPT